MKLVNKWIRDKRNINKFAKEFSIEKDIIAKVFEWIYGELDQYDSIISLTSHLYEDGSTNFPEWLDDQYDISYDVEWDALFTAIGEAMESEI